MTQTGVVSWSQTAATNATADSNVNWAEGMPPSAVNDSARAAMSSVAKYRDDTAGSVLTGGTSTAYTVTSNQVFSSLTVLNGQSIKVRFNAACGASPTLNVDSLGAKQITYDGTNNVAAGVIPSNSVWDVTYDNSLGVFILNHIPKIATLATLTAQFLDTTALDAGTKTNFSLSATVASNILTVTLNAAGGSAPTATNPVFINCPADAGGTGTPNTVKLTSALTIDTHATGATLGASNGVPFRLWVVLFPNVGTPMLALINCSNGTTIFPLNSTRAPGTTAMSGSATSAGVFYTENGVSPISTGVFTILGFLEYETALATAGTYNNPPDWTRLFIPGMKTPGDIVQTLSSAATSLNITPTSAANLVKFFGYINGTCASTSNFVTVAFKRNTNTFFTQNLGGTSGQLAATASAQYLDAPNLRVSTTYSMSVGGATYSSQNEYIMLDEVMG